MTSIHGRIPSDLQDLAHSARSRGETAGTAMGKDTDQRPTMKGRSGSSLTSFLIRKSPDCVTHVQSAPSPLDQALKSHSSASEKEGSTSASKENDRLLSPSPVTVPTPRRPSTAKRPLSDLHTIEPEYDMTNAPCLSPSQQNIVNNVNSSARLAASEKSQKCLRLMEKGLSGYMTGHGQETGASSTGSSTGSDDLEGKPTKRICSHSGKENILENWEIKKSNGAPLPGDCAATEHELSASRKAPMSNALGESRVKGKLRVGLRRL